MDAGAEYAITQPVFDAAQLETFISKIGDTHIPIIAGIWPLVSVRNAEFLANEVPGVSVPQAAPFGKVELALEVFADGL